MMSMTDSLGFPRPLRFPFLGSRGELGRTMRALGGLRMPERYLAPPASLGRIGPPEVRLATTSSEIRRAQKLRWNVFYREMSAVPVGALRFFRRDVDRYDAICDHLIVVDHDRMELSRMGRLRPAIVGTYRLLRGDVAERHGGFYSANEFDLSGLMARHEGARFLELGRSCVEKPYRNKRTVELLWHGIWAYVLRHRIDVLFGCASLEGTDPAQLALPLSFLHHNAKAPAEWLASAQPGRGIAMDMMPAGAIAMKEALNALPPLVKGYLRVGAVFGEGAVVDHQFGTTDVLVILPRELINPRYVNHYGADAGRYAA